MDENSITEMGNPAKPQGEAGEIMLKRMSESHKNVTDWALAHLNINGAEKVLDIGCGGGMALQKMSAKITTGHLTGVDYSEVSVELSRKVNADDVDNGKMDIIHASVENLPFDDNSFNIIYTIESFYFWKNPVDCLKEVQRVLSPDGIFLIIADIYGDSELSAEDVENINKYNLFNPTRAEFKDLLEKSGFFDIKIHTKDGTTWICTESKKFF
ncbi:MAG: class I SAM-dependent methyltransferase [Ruminococcus sp.]|nr:class I SAM-dependent methyltransferase [Ruminococcus sp.]